ncbi:MAG TPA: hypothetical protein VJL28_00615 [Gemmatimonadaceae bacterium]|nr:hypothetical protein [Gemmatimonadaceae bacterium]
MKSLTRAKLALALTGIMVFGVGIRLDNPTARWTGIGLVAAAWLSRFVKDRKGT